MTKLQYTDTLNGLNIFVEDDDSVNNDGVPMPDAILSTFDGALRIDLDGDGLIEVTQLPTIVGVTVHRESDPNALLFLIEEAPNVDKSLCAISLLASYTGNNIIKTTNLFSEDDDDSGVWRARMREIDLSSDITLSLQYDNILYGKRQFHVTQDSGVFMSFGGDLPV